MGKAVKHYFCIHCQVEMAKESLNEIETGIGKVLMCDECKEDFDDKIGEDHA
jgi:hypothetical protein